MVPRLSRRVFDAAEVLLWESLPGPSRPRYISTCGQKYTTCNNSDKSQSSNSAWNSLTVCRATHNQQLPRLSFPARHLSTPSRYGSSSQPFSSSAPARGPPPSNSPAGEAGGEGKPSVKSEGPVVNEAIRSKYVIVVDPETGKLLSRSELLETLVVEAKRNNESVLQVAWRPQDVYPTVKIISNRTLIQQKSSTSKKKSGAKGGQANTTQIEFSWLVTDHDLQHKIGAAMKATAKSKIGSKIHFRVVTKKDTAQRTGGLEGKVEVIKRVDDMLLRLWKEARQEERLAAFGDVGSKGDGKTGAERESQEVSSEAEGESEAAEEDKDAALDASKPMSKKAQKKAAAAQKQSPTLKMGLRKSGNITWGPRASTAEWTFESYEMKQADVHKELGL